MITAMELVLEKMNGVFVNWMGDGLATKLSLTLCVMMGMVIVELMMFAIWYVVSEIFYLILSFDVSWILAVSAAFALSVIAGVAIEAMDSTVGLGYAIVSVVTGVLVPIHYIRAKTP